MKSKLGIAMVVLCVLSFLTYQSQGDSKKKNQTERVIFGKIINSMNNEPIVGASVAHQGKNPSSLSNADGEFAIQAKDDDELVFRHSEYKTKIVQAKDSKIVSLEASNPE